MVTPKSPAPFAKSIRRRRARDRVIESLLLLAGLVAVFTTLAIVWILVAAWMVHLGWVNAGV